MLSSPRDRARDEAEAAYTAPRPPRPTTREQRDPDHAAPAAQGRPRRAAPTALNFTLRLASLAGKMVLSLYMARAFGLAELGVYGLAFGCVMVANALFGFRLDYVICRDVGQYDRDRISTTLTAAMMFYVANYTVAALIIAVFAKLGAIALPARVLLSLYVLCCFESCANLQYNVLIALGRSTLANALFFIRAGSWAVPAIALSWVHPELRNAVFVIVCWICGAGASIAGSMAALAVRGVRLRLAGASQAAWLRSSLRQIPMIWVGSVAVTSGAYLDRFLLARFATLTDVGVATFYLSFTTAVLTLIQSSTVAVNFSSLIRHYDRADRHAYSAEFRQLAWLAGVLSGMLLLAVGVAIPAYAVVVQKPALLTHVLGMALLLAATWLRTHAESAYYLLFVERKNTAIWLGNILFLAASAGFNICLIPPFGVTGLGLAAVLSSAFLLGWRGWFGRHSLRLANPAPFVLSSPDPVGPPS